MHNNNNIFQGEKMRLSAIVCVQDQGKNGKDFRLIYYFDDKGEIKTRTKIIPKKKPIVNSVIKQYPVADLFEREIHDYYGVEFMGNLKLHTTILLPEEEKHHHPLLK